MMPLAHRQYRRDEGDDYLALHRQGKRHAGIAYGPPPALKIAEDPSLTAVDLGVMAPGEMKNHVQFEQGGFR
jgi:hypothetical protein